MWITFLRSAAKAIVQFAETHPELLKAVVQAVESARTPAK